jgi:hypothetical protein
LVYIHVFLNCARMADVRLSRLACRAYTTAVYLHLSKLREAQDMSVTQYKKRRPASFSNMGDAIDNSEQDTQAGRLPGLSTRTIRRSFLVRVVVFSLRHCFQHKSSFAAWGAFQKKLSRFASAS